MHLIGLRIAGLIPFRDIVLPFVDDGGEPRMLTVLYGASGVGKTTVVHAIGSTRPGYAIAQPKSATTSQRSEGDLPWVNADWRLGDDDPERPHALRIASPGGTVLLDAEAELLRRREQALFDKLAKDRGFVFLAFASTRWFSRQPLVLTSPVRGVGRYDVRTPHSLDDATRSDLSRETKQSLAYAEIGSALQRSSSSRAAVPKLEILGAAMRTAVNTLVSLTGHMYHGLDPLSFEPMFSSPTGQRLSFDSLPNQARHLVAFAALPTRALWAAYTGSDPRVSEGVVCIDDVDLHQDRGTQARLLPALRAALPGVQWILTTSSSEVAGSADTRDVLALRWDDDEVALYAGVEARVH
ncbi:MAG: hypothetical protein H6718_17265 [Polyangiaceae bacterium]|nr:hypothetical protein [Myxococcales bacterium]MCB9587152.1 hypothetical protein [Polyangiaceae bacterium]